MAEDDDNSQKTEEPTAKRLSEAHKQGQGPVSRELNHWFSIGGGALVVLAFAPGMAKKLAAALTPFIAEAHQIPDSNYGMGQALKNAATIGAKVVAVPLLIMIVFNLAGSLLQTGFIFSGANLKPSLSKLSLLAGVKRLFAVRSVTEFLKSMGKFAMIGGVSFILLKPALPTIDHLIAVEPIGILGELRHLVLHLCVGVLSSLTFIMIADLFYQRLSFIARLRMTKQELKDEMKQSEGDPIIKARIRQIRMRKARARMMAAVPTADVVITNPTHYAIAMKYDPKEMTAPLVVAKGQDLIALKIRELAKENDVAIVENPPLARALYGSVEVDDEIPPEHYKAVAEIISYVFRLRNRIIQR